MLFRLFFIVIYFFIKIIWEIIEHTSHRKHKKRTTKKATIKINESKNNNSLTTSQKNEFNEFKKSIAECVEIINSPKVSRKVKLDAYEVALRYIEIAISRNYGTTKNQKDVIVEMKEELLTEQKSLLSEIG